MTSTDKTDIFGFKYWPFPIVPRPEDEIVWADRTVLKQQVIRLGNRLGRHSAVSLHLLWADFGAGKTHTLLYLKQEAQRGKFGTILPLYCALPKSCRDFIDIYRAIVRGIPEQVLRDAYQKALVASNAQAVDRAVSAISANFSRCIQRIAMGSETQQRVAMAWLHSESGIPARELTNMSIMGRLRTTDDATAVLGGIVKLFNLAGHSKVVLMVDEFQRVEVLRKQQQDDINAGLHGFFNSCASGMSLLLSFSFGVEENIRHFLNKELLSRADPLRISIPTMTRAEGLEFLSDVVMLARDPSTNWCVSDAVIPEIVRSVEERLKLTPRRLLKAAGLVFSLAEIDLEEGVISDLTIEYVEGIVERGEFNRIDDEESN